jgi:DNA-binding LytR/AlgR family response regulator
MGKSIKILIIEDEALAAKRLERLLSDTEFDIEVIMKCESVATSVAYLQSNPAIDLILMDIRLGDGISLDILEQTNINIPVIFTTAYDEYTLKAFKLQSIDYLLKPIDHDELKSALAKYQKIYQYSNKAAISDHETPTHTSFRYKERYLVKTGNHLMVIRMKEIAYFYTDNGYTHIVTNNNKKYLIDDALDTVQKMVDPEEFFRINRAMLISLNSIEKMETYFNSRYSLTLHPGFSDQVIVSRERVKEFKDWIEK